MDDRLVPCGACLRHVRCAEVACPFCGAAVSMAPMPSREPFRRMAAAAAVAAGVAALTGCSDNGSATGFYGGAGPSEDASNMADEGSALVYYGAPNVEDGSIVAFYGGASIEAGGVLPDAGTDATRDGSSTDASDSGMGNPSDAQTDAPQDG